MLTIKMEDGIASYWNDDTEITEAEYLAAKEQDSPAKNITVRRFRVSLNGILTEEA